MSFLRYLPLLCVLPVLPARAMTDSNDNGLSDLWEFEYNNQQLLPSTFDPEDDADGDGASNLKEAVAGTNPFDGKPPGGYFAAEVAHVPAVYLEAGGETELLTPEAFVVSWPTYAGKRYTLLVSPNLSTGSWTLIEEAIPGNGSTIQIAINPQQEGGGIPEKLFWRVSVEDTDTDGDGFNDWEETIKGTNPLVADRDDDGLPDDWEIRHGLDPNDNGSINPENGPDGDPDGDGVPNSDEFTADSSPQDSNDFPEEIHWVFNSVSAGSNNLDPLPLNGFIKSKPWNSMAQVNQTIAEVLTPAMVDEAVEAMTFPATAAAARSVPYPAGLQRAPLEYAGSNGAHAIYYANASGKFLVANQRASRNWVHTPPKPVARDFRFFKVIRNEKQTPNQEPAITFTAESVTLTVPANATYSQAIDLECSSIFENDKVNTRSAFLLPISISAAFGLGPEPVGPNTSRELLEQYLDTIKVARSGDLWAVKHNNTIHAIELANTKEKLIAALGSQGRTVIYDGHANYGLGPNFSPNATHKTSPDFVLFGTGVAAIPQVFRGDGSEPDIIQFTLNDGTALPTNQRDLDAIARVHSEGWAYLGLQQAQIPVNPANYLVAPLNVERFENRQGIAPGSSFTLQGSGVYGQWHYQGTGGDNYLIVPAPSSDIPKLRYSTFFYNACSTGRYYIENFMHGDFVYTKDVCHVEKATTVFVRAMIEGKSLDQTRFDLNQPGIANTTPGSPPVYDYKSF